jgi:hypothetical protein
MVERLFANWEKFQSPPRHPKWKEVNLAATVPGWTRWAPVEDLLKAMRAQHAQQAQAVPGRTHNRIESSTSNLSEAERERLFLQFQNWQKRQR